MASVSTVATIHSLPPELFALIANEITLPDRPPALLSLAIANRQISGMVLPALLYEHVIIHTERSLVSAVDILCRRADIRAIVRGFYVQASLAMGEDRKYPAMTKLADRFRQSGLFGVHTLTLKLGPHSGQPLCAFKSLSETFWIDITTCCPNLRNIGFNHLDTASLWDLRSVFPWGRHSHLSSFKVVHHSFGEVWDSDSCCARMSLTSRCRYYR
jgi:hypothetical protein